MVCVMLFRTTWEHMVSDSMNYVLEATYAESSTHRPKRTRACRKAGSLGTSDHVENRAEDVLVVRQDTAYQNTLAKAQWIVPMCKPGRSLMAALSAVFERMETLRPSVPEYCFSRFVKAGKKA